MRTLTSRRTTAPALAVAALLALTGCSGSAADDAPPPLASQPPEVAALPQGIGEYFVTPRADATDEEIEGTVARLREDPIVQRVELLDDGRIDVELRGGNTPADNDRVLRQLAALGEVSEGI